MITQYENTIRKLILDILGNSEENIYKISNDRVEKWRKKRLIEQKKHNGILIEKRLIYYSDFYDLKTIIDKNWEKLLPILKNKSRFMTFFIEMEQYRNTVSHGRNLTKSQQDLLSGIYLDLRNLITIYHNKNEMKDDFFVRINVISDNLGNSWPGNNSNLILRVGDYYEVIVDASDPKNGKVKYQLITNKGVVCDFQESNVFSIIIDKNMVAQSENFIIVAKNFDSDYDNRDGKVIRLSILPE